MQHKNETSTVSVVTTFPRMRILLPLLIFIFIILAQIFTLPTVSAARDDIQLSLISYDPRPVTPGGVFTITFKAKNIAGVNLTNVEFTLEPESDFVIEGSDSVEVSEMKKGEEILLPFTVAVRPEVRSGFSTLTLEYDARNRDDQSFSLQVRAIEPTLEIARIQTIPERIAPGNRAELSITLLNKAQFSLKSIELSLDLSSKELPFAPIDSSAEKTVVSLQGGETTVLRFPLISVADAAEGIYKIPIKAHYFDEFGKEYTKTTLTALVLGSEPKISVTAEESALIEGTKGTISLQIVNKGLGDITFLSVSLGQNSEAYTLLSSIENYVGDLDSDDFSSLEIDIIPRVGGTISIPLILNYRNSNNNEVQEFISIPVQVYSQRRAQELGVSSRSYWGIMFIGVIVLVLVFFLFRMLKRALRKT